MHGSEFVTQKPPAEKTNPFLLEQDRPGGNHSYQQTDEHHQWQQQGKCHNDQRNVQRPLPARFRKDVDCSIQLAVVMIQVQ
jgi:hypothetical protein